MAKYSLDYPQGSLAAGYYDKERKNTTHLKAHGRVSVGNSESGSLTNFEFHYTSQSRITGNSESRTTFVGEFSRRGSELR